MTRLKKSYLPINVIFRLLFNIMIYFGRTVETDKKKKRSRLKFIFKILNFKFTCFIIGN